MQFIQKNIYFIASGILVTAFLVANAMASTAIDPCPSGSYSIGTDKNGQHLCKIQPTGCPYGDSIPLGPDCDKHAPQAPQTTVESESITSPAKTESPSCQQ